jgi:hypothetical protein
VRDTGEANAIGTVTVEYFAERNGDADITTLIYYTDGGQQTVGNPRLPFNTTVSLRSVPARIRATGTTGSGSYAIGYRISDAVGPLESTRLTCP